jgi:hypothetical protein
MSRRCPFLPYTLFQLLLPFSGFRSNASRKRSARDALGPGEDLKLERSRTASSSSDSSSLDHLTTICSGRKQTILPSIKLPSARSTFQGCSSDPEDKSTGMTDTRCTCTQRTEASGQEEEVGAAAVERIDV